MKFKVKLVVGAVITFVSAVFILLKSLENLEKPTPPNHNLEVTIDINRFEQQRSSIISDGHEDSDTTEIASTVKNRNNLWDMWKKWVDPDYLYPIAGFRSLEMKLILEALATSPVLSFGVGHKGTQLKASMELLEHQRTVFKPMRYTRDEIVDGPDNPYAGYDRHNGFRLAPPVAGRRLNLSALLPVTSTKLHDTYITKNGSICFYGKCYYCKPTELACADKDIMEGSVTLWLPEWYQLKTWRHPYQRTYVLGRKAKWEVDSLYCDGLLKQSSDYYHLMPDIWDTTVFDYLMGNADRHHFEVYAARGKLGRLLHIDNGKTFGNPHHDESSILAPLRQCCRIRNTTWTTLKRLIDSPLSKVLDDALRNDLLYPILSTDHLLAIDRRHTTILHEIDKCIEKHGQGKVIFNKWDYDV